MAPLEEVRLALWPLSWPNRPTMLLALDTATPACTAALFDGAGTCIGRSDERIGRGTPR